MKKQKRPTLADVARQAGTSTAVVSYVVNDGPRRVSPQTRERVNQAIKQLGYRRNTLAAALKGNKSNLVGLVVPDASNAFFGELSTRMEGEASRRSLLTLLGNTHYGAESEQKYERAFSDLNCMAIFIVGVGDGSRVDSKRIYLHAAPPGSSSPSVVFDNFAGAVGAVEHLLGHGYSDVHCLTGPVDHGPTALREQGFRAAGGETMHRFPRDRKEAEEAMVSMLDSDAPRAVFCTTDEHALACLRAAGRQGLRVPEDLAIVGFDGINEALNGSVAITTVSLPLDELAVTAFEMLDAWRGDVPPSSKTLPSSLLIGETCGCEREIRSP
ncbi:LacI family DNA-binding transcriptional regulator [Kribbella sp. NPDC050124]|uniref:LacI family DNA-binding transcriptional regulator n=1 Tax=Kribbella sp. NPDC050124 TaxID=3364114 RepID=UPI0037920EB5